MPDSNMLKGLVKRAEHELGTEIVFRTHELEGGNSTSVARWWMNAISDVIDAEADRVESVGVKVSRLAQAHVLRGIANWLRTQAQESNDV